MRVTWIINVHSEDVTHKDVIFYKGYEDVITSFNVILPIFSIQMHRRPKLTLLCETGQGHPRVMVHNFCRG